MKLLNLFKKDTINDVVVIEEPKVVLKGKTTNEIVEEIHESFYTEVDRLLENSKILKSTESQLEDLILKADKLKSLGFTNTKECKDAQIEIDRLNLIKRENKSKESLTEAINYFTQKYPFNKFITEESVIKICNKYNLVYGPIERYEGTVPDKNLNEIANSKVKKEDFAYIENETTMYYNFDIDDPSNIRYINEYHFNHYTSKEEVSKRNKEYYSSINRYYTRSVSYSKCPLEIAAPIKDFNMKGYEVKGVKISKIHIPDPVVLQPVFYNNTKHYLILSAWGLEASDELVVNNKFN